MNYLLLKGILDATLSHFICRGCSGKADERNVDIAGIHDSTLHIDVRCPQCGLVSNIKAEVNMIGGNNSQSDFLFDQSQKNSGSIFDSTPHTGTSKKGSLTTQQSISDADIIKLRDTLGKSLSASELFGSLDS